MSHSERLRLSDVRDALRLLGEVREVGADPHAWRAHMLRGLCRLTGATVGMSVECYDWGRTHPHFPVLVDLGWRGEAERVEFMAFMAGGEFPRDPAVEAAKRLQLSRRGFTVLRAQYVDDAVWYGAPSVADGRRTADIDDEIHSSRPLTTPDGTDDISLHRPWNAKKFGVRERRLIRFFHIELARLWHAHSQSGGIFADLAPHLRRVALHLAAGLSEKEAAVDLGLSIHTVHAYTKSLYRRLDVSSRAEFIARHTRRYDFTPSLMGRPRRGQDL